MFMLRIIAGIQALKEGGGVIEIVKVGEPEAVRKWWVDKDFHCTNCNSVFRITNESKDKVSYKIYKGGHGEESICPKHGSHEHFLGNPKCAHYTTKCPVCNFATVEISKVFESQKETTR